MSSQDRSSVGTRNRARTWQVVLVVCGVVMMSGTAVGVALAGSPSVWQVIVFVGGLAYVVTGALRLRRLRAHRS